MHLPEKMFAKNELKKPAIPTAMYTLVMSGARLNTPNKSQIAIKLQAAPINPLKIASPNFVIFSFMNQIRLV